jgi:hypothetical protein
MRATHETLSVRAVIKTMHGGAMKRCIGTEGIHPMPTRHVLIIAAAGAISVTGSAERSGGSGGGLIQPTLVCLEARGYRVVVHYKSKHCRSARGGGVQ